MLESFVMLLSKYAGLVTLHFVIRRIALYLYYLPIFFFFELENIIFSKTTTEMNKLER